MKEDSLASGTGTSHFYFTYLFIYIFVRCLPLPTIKLNHMKLPFLKFKKLLSISNFMWFNLVDY